VDNLHDSNALFNQDSGFPDSGTTFSIQYADATGAVQTADVTLAATDAGQTGTAFVSSLNAALSAQGLTGIAAQIGTGGDLQFSGGNLLQVTESDDVAAGTNVVTSGSSLLNGSNYQTGSLAYTTFASGQSQEFTFTTGGATKTVTLNNGNSATEGAAVSALNTGLSGTGIYAVETATGIAIQSSSAFTVSSAAASGAGNLGGTGAGAIAVNEPTTSASSTGNALNAITAIASAIKNLGLVQGAVGAGENKLNYAVNLANSQITNFSSAESQIMDANVASAAANLTKSQVLEQSTIAAMAQANSEPQAVLKLLQQ